MPSRVARLLFIFAGPTGLPPSPPVVAVPFRPRSMSVALHDQAQDLRQRYAAQLVALEAAVLPASQCTGDAGLIAERLVIASAEFYANDPSYDGSWLSRYLPAALVQARLQAPVDGPLEDDLLAGLGVQAPAGLDSTLGVPLGEQLSGGTTVADIDAALATL